MSVRPVTERFTRDAAKANLVKLVPLTILVKPRVHEMGAVRESCRAQKIRIALAQQTTQNIENPSERVGTARKSRWFARLQQSAVWNMDFHQVIETIVKHDLRIKHHDHVHAAEHFEHFLI